MKSRNKIASIVLLLVALVVGFDARLGWSQKWQFFYPSQGDWQQCTIGPDAAGLAVLQDGRVLVAGSAIPQGLYYYPSFPSDPSQCPGPPTLLKSGSYLGLTVGLDGKVYAFAYQLSGIADLVAVNLNGGPDTTLLKNVGGLGMALDPLTGDLYMTTQGTTGTRFLTRDTVYQVTNFYCPSCVPAITPFVTVGGVLFDGLGWSCDGRFLFVASPFTSSGTRNNQVYRFSRGALSYLTKIAILPGVHFGPDGITVGAAGTALASYVYSNNNDGSVTRFTSTTNTFGFPYTIADGAGPGDFAFVDAQGAMVVRQGAPLPLGTHLQRLSPSPTGVFAGGQFVLPGSSICSDLGCGSQAATVPQIDYDDQPCLTGLDAELVLSLSQAACGKCQDCNTLNQTRGTFLDLLNSLDPPHTCLNSLKATLTNLYLSCPCNCPCPNCRRDISTLSLGPCFAQTKFPLGFDLESYDPIVQAFIKKVLSP